MSKLAYTCAQLTWNAIVDDDPKLEYLRPIWVLGALLREANPRADRWGFWYRVPVIWRTWAPWGSQ